MRTLARRSAVVVATIFGAGASFSQPADPRLREVVYDPRAVVTVPVKRGVVTHIVLDDDEAITDVGAGLGGDCSKPETAWCIAALPGGHNIFVKPKTTANVPNNLAVVTDRRAYSLRFVVLADGDPKVPVYRLVIRPPVARAAAAAPVVEPPALPSPRVEPLPSPQAVVAERMKATPEVLNADYSMAVGESSGDIVPTLVFDDGRFTYFSFAGNREVPAVFQVLGDGSETLVNARMEDKLLVVDRVSRRLMLRAGSAVVGIWNDAFDLEGRPPSGGTTVPGVERVIKAQASAVGRTSALREQQP